MKKNLFVITFVIFLCASLSAAEKSADAYIKDLSSKDAATVIKAEKWLGEKEEKAAVTKLVENLQNSNNAEIRKQAAVALGLIEDKKAVEPLIDQLLKEQNADVRYAIVLAVTRIGIENKAQYEKLVQAKNNETDPIIKDYVEKLEEKLKAK